MKMLSNNIIVIDRSYYYLLDWNEQDERKYINNQFNKNRLCDLTYDEYKQLFIHATAIDSNNLKSE